MTTTDVTGPVMGIMGAGITLGALAHMTRNISHITDDLYAPRHRHIKRNNTPRHQYRPRRVRVPIRGW